jgi:EAL domain-containing protein (putative c-di-GMP-specific phosphodiesterase class I)/GGDEF domain-containing protein
VSAPQPDYYRLRTEWLRFKSQLFDPLTGLPALAAVTEDVRRMIEAHGLVDLVYLDLGQAGRHETAHGWAAYDQAVKEFAAVLRGMRNEGDLGPHDALCVLSVGSDRFVVVFAEPDRDGAGALARRDEFLARLRRRLGGLPPGHLVRHLGFSVGHARVLLDPMVRSERGIQHGVGEAMLASLADRQGQSVVQRLELKRLIDHGSIRTVFHPIVELASGNVIGHEALTRPVGEVTFDSVEDIFSFAETTELLVAFERLCRLTAIRAAARHDGLGLLFLNASARAVEDPAWPAAMDAAVKEAGLLASDIVVEITERVAIVSHDDFQGALRIVKDRGYRVAVDDMGAGYSSLQTLAAIEPEFLKFDVSLVRGIDRSSIKRSLLESLCQLAGKIGARVVAEGIERAEEIETLRQVGVELGQGFFFQRDGEPA